MFLILQSEAHAAEHGEVFSDDELPPGVDLSDPYFAEELKDSGKVKKKGIFHNSYKEYEWVLFLQLYGIGHI